MRESEHALLDLPNPTATDSLAVSFIESYTCLDREWTTRLFFPSAPTEDGHLGWGHVSIMALDRIPIWLKPACHMFSALLVVPASSLGGYSLARLG